MNSPPDASTRQLAAAAEGDLEAFGDFYDENAEALLRYFYGRTACPETAADLTAETFATVLESVGKFRPAAGSGRAWLYGIARNKLNRFLRWRRVDTRSRAKLGMRAIIDLDAESRERIEEDDFISSLAGRLATALDGMSPTAVQFATDDDAPFWQRPVAGHALFPFETGPISTFRVTAFDQDGDVFGEWVTDY